MRFVCFCTREIELDDIMDGISFRLVKECHRKRNAGAIKELTE